jgi:hypothetical protein
MTFEEFKASLADAAPSAGAASALQALWWQGKGDWQRAHELAQSADEPDEAWVHAHLHRVEGDLGNAGYWYRRAGQKVASEALEAEWATIAKALLAR